MLRTNSLIGFGSGGAGGGSSVTLTYEGGYSSGAGPFSSMTYSSAPLGTAEAGRIIIVGAHVPLYSGSVDISSVTVGSTSCTKLVDVLTTGSEPFDIWGAVHATGTTGDVVVSNGGNGQYGTIAVWSLLGANSTPTDTATDTGTGLRTSLTIPSGGAAIGWAMGLAGTTVTWNTNMSADASISRHNGGLCHAATDIVAGADTITATWSSQHSYDTLALAAFEPV